MIDLSGGSDPSSWALLPTHDRAMVGGTTVWLGGHTLPLVVPQPNRWGVIEQAFPDVPCVVEADPEVTPWMPLPPRIEGWLDRLHQPVDTPRRTQRGRQLMRRADRLGTRLSQIKGVSVVRRPFGRTLPLLTPLEPALLIAAAAGSGVVGIHPIPGLGGGVTITIGHEHTDNDLDRVVSVVSTAVASDQ